MTEDKVVGWHHYLNGHEFEQAPGVGDEQGKPGVLQSMGSQSRTRFSDSVQFSSVVSDSATP